MGWGYARSRGVHIEQLGFSGSGSTTAVVSGSVGTFGTLTSIGTTTFPYDNFTLSIGNQSSVYGIVTLTANTGGDDEVIADSIPFCSRFAGACLTCHIDFPVRISSGATIKAKVATAIAGSVNTRVSITGYNSGALVRGFSKAVLLTDLTGVDATNTITLNGTTLTSWVQLASSTSAETGLLKVGLISNASVAIGSTGQIYVEIGYGAAASEVALFRVPQVVNTLFVNSPNMGIPVSIPAGTRLAARAQASAATSGVIEAICWGCVP